jgi:hypothetical protein
MSLCLETHVHVHIEKVFLLTVEIRHAESVQYNIYIDV